MANQINKIDMRALQAEQIEVFGNKGRIDPNKRVLIIGLGGTGTDTLLLTKHTIINRFKLDDGKIPDNIQLLAIDTDKGILGKSRGTTKIEQHEFEILDDPQIAACLMDKSKLPNYFVDWVNPHLNVPPGVVPGTDGAGAIRQIGRYLLISNYKKVYGKIHDKIQQTIIAAQGGQLIDIIILSGISGGTGSGTFIDMGYIVRKVCNDMVIPDLKKQITAYLYLPDVNIGNPNVPKDAHNFIKCNGYAALKDLDHFMSIPKKNVASARSDAKKTYEFKQNYTHTDRVVMECAPFDATYLISGVPNVLNILADAYEYSISLTSDSIVNFMAGNAAQGHTDQLQPGVQAVDINGAAMKAANATVKLPDGKDILANYEYKIIGASLATLPMQSITNYIAGRLLSKIKILKDQKPMKEDFDKFYKTVGIKNIENDVFKKIGNPTSPVTGKEIHKDQNNRLILIKSLKDYLARAKTNLPGIVKTETELLKKRIIVELDKCFADINQGPFFANKLLADPQNGIIKYIQETASNFARRSAQYSDEALRCKALAETEYQAGEKVLMGKDTKFQNYVNYMCDRCRNEVGAEICKEIAKCFNNNELGKDETLVDAMLSKNKNIFDVFTLILTTLGERFTDAYEGVTTVQQSAGKAFIWDVVDIKQVEPVIQKSIDQAGLDTKLVALLTKMIKKAENWCNGTAQISEFGEFISDEFAGILGLSMDKYLGNVPADRIMECIKELDRKARYHFPSIQGVSVVGNNICNRITVPSTAPKMKQYIVDYLDNNNIKTAPSDSMLTERISWTRVGIGVPVFQYAYLQQYEKAYENIGANNKQGMHLFENKGLHGTEYPAIMPKAFYSDDYENRREERRYKSLYDIFDRAEELGFVDYDPDSAFFKITKEGWIEGQIDGVLQKHKIDPENIEGSVVDVNDLYDCIEAMKAIMKGDVEYEYIFIPETAGYTSDPETARYYAKEYFTKMPEAAVYVEKEIANIDKLNGVIKALDDMIESFNSEKDVYMSFIYSLMNSVIQVNGAIVSYGEGEDKLMIANKLKDKLWRYAAFKAFTETVYPIEKDGIDTYINDASESTEELEKMYNYCTELLKLVMTSEMPQLKQVGDDENGKAVKAFYNKLNLFINAEITSLKEVLGK